jgi:hypothetical protein
MIERFIVTTKHRTYSFLIDAYEESVNLITYGEEIKLILPKRKASSELYYDLFYLPENKNAVHFAKLFGKDFILTRMTQHSVYTDGMEYTYCITLQKSLDEIKIAPATMGQNTQFFPML